MANTQIRTFASRVNRNQYTEMKIDSRPTLEQMALAMSIPPPKDFMGLGSWVEHIAAPRKDSVAKLIEEMLGYPQVSKGTTFVYQHLSCSPPAASQKSFLN
jgi:hypothetical protein